MGPPYSQGAEEVHWREWYIAVRSGEIFNKHELDRNQCSDSGGLCCMIQDQRLS